MNICVNCENCGFGKFKGEFFSKCTVPCLRGKVEEVVDPIDGGITLKAERFCWAEREEELIMSNYPDGERCGREGKFFKPKR